MLSIDAIKENAKLAVNSIAANFQKELSKTGILGDKTKAPSATAAAKVVPKTTISKTSTNKNPPNKK